MYSTVMKNSSDVAVCAVEIGVGSRNSTVIPPSSACANTSPTASHPNGRRRRSAASRVAVSRPASTSVRITTVPAARRWLCSTSTPPSILGMNVP